MRFFWRLVAGVLGGILIGVLAYVVIVMATGGSDPRAVVVPAVLGGFALGLVSALTAPRAGNAWRRLFILAGLICLCLPLATLSFSAIYVNEAEPRGNAESVGMALGGTMAVGMAAVIGAVAGGAFLVVGLLMGGAPKDEAGRPKGTPPEDGAA